VCGAAGQIRTRHAASGGEVRATFHAACRLVSRVAFATAIPCRCDRPEDSYHHSSNHDGNREGSGRGRRGLKLRQDRL
jgi:hypothetical protein